MKQDKPPSEHDGKKHRGRAKPKFSDRPPVVPARVAAMKARYRQAWFFFLFAISMVVAWGIPIRYAVMRYLMFRPADIGPRVSNTFVALAYQGLSAKPGDVSPELFREHLSALQEAGYNPITLEDIQAFYDEGTLLPRRAILMTFDRAQKSAYFDVRSVLARAGWPAVIFLWTYPIQTEDPASLRWPYVRAMLRSGAWDIGSQGHRSFERIPADNEGTLRNFMAAPRWISEDMRHETPRAFSERLQADHEFARALIQKETGVTPRAYAFPYGDFGQYDARALLSRRLNMDMISAFYDLGFIYGASALNTRYSDPRRLNRLHVQGEWTGNELVRRLENAWPREEGISNNESLVSPFSWLNEWGGFFLQDRRLRIFALPETTGAKIWLNGSDLHKDFTARFRLRVVKGQVELFFRASPDGESHLFLSLNENGEAWLRQKHAGLQPFTLASAQYTPDPDGVVTLEINLRSHLFFVNANGKSLSQDIVTIRGEPRPGMVGISVWDPVMGRASTEFTSIEIQPVRPTVLTWPAPASRSPELAAWINQHAVRYPHLAPPWLHITSEAQIEQAGWNPDLFRSLARIYGLQWTPEIILENIDSFDPAQPERLANVAANLHANGLYFNLGDMHSASSLSRVTAWIQTLSRALEQQEQILIVRLPPHLKKESTFAALLQNLPNLKIAVADNPDDFLRDHPVESRRIVRVETIETQRVPIPFFTQLTGGEAEFDYTEEEIRGSLLQKEGYAAFQDGKFQEALGIYRRWSELEPMNETPPRRMGDIYLRLREYGLALQQYRSSLDRNPGQIPLVVKTAHLLYQQMENREEAESLLTLYTDLFPHNSALLLAKANLLIQSQRPEEAAPIIRQVIKDNPSDLNALSMLHGLLPTFRERMQNMYTILEVGTRPGIEPHFADVIRSHRLLNWPESWILMSHIEAKAAKEKEEGESGPYLSLVPRKTIVQETFRQGRMSENWITDTKTETIEEGAYLLGAQASTTEATLRLTNSNAMHSGFVDAMIDESRGFFWLYARRAENSMVRFGFEQAGRLYLQLWQNGRLLVNQSRVWNRPDGPGQFRIEIRGDAAFGFVDGQPAFGAPIRLPPDMGLGWWGVSPWSHQFGVAQASLREVGGGPLPITLALFWPKPQPEVWTDDEMIALLKDKTREIHAVIPPWFVQETAGRIRPEHRGRIRPEHQGEFKNLRTLARFYQIRLLPAVHSAIPQNIDLRELLPLAEEMEVDGFTLLFPRMPDEEWFLQAEQDLAGSMLSILVARVNRIDGFIEIREIGPCTGLFSGQRTVRTLPLVDTSQPHEPPVSPADESPDPDPDLEKLPRPDFVWLY